MPALTNTPSSPVIVQPAETASPLSAPFGTEPIVFSRTNNVETSTVLVTDNRGAGGTFYFDLGYNSDGELLRISGYRSTP